MVDVCAVYHCIAYDQRHRSQTHTYACETDRRESAHESALNTLRCTHTILIGARIGYIGRRSAFTPKPSAPRSTSPHSKRKHPHLSQCLQHLLPPPSAPAPEPHQRLSTATTNLTRPAARREVPRTAILILPSIHREDRSSHISNILHLRPSHAKRHQHRG